METVGGNQQYPTARDKLECRVLHSRIFISLFFVKFGTHLAALNPFAGVTRVSLSILTVQVGALRTPQSRTANFRTVIEPLGAKWL